MPPWVYLLLYLYWISVFAAFTVLTLVALYAAVSPFITPHIKPSNYSASAPPSLESIQRSMLEDMKRIEQERDQALREAQRTTEEFLRAVRIITGEEV